MNTRQLVRCLLSTALLSTTALNAAEELYVEVADRGKPVENLTASNFRLSEQDRPAVVESAQPAEAASVVLLVENSLASWEYLNEVNSAMKGFKKAAPEMHDYALVSYGTNADVEATLRRSANRVIAAYVGRKASATKDVSTHDAIVRTLDELESLDRRAVMIVIGSGEDRFSETTYGQLIERVERTPVTIYTIQIGTSLPSSSAAPQIDAESGEVHQPPVPKASRTGEMLLRAIADRSGGELYCPSCEAGFRTAVEEIFDSIAKTYRVSYARPAASEPGFVKFKVQAFRLDDDERHDFRARTRQGRRY